MPSIALEITDHDIDAAVAAIVHDGRIDRACPLATVAQRQIERPVRVFRNSWHLARRPGDETPATFGERLPDAATSWIAEFDDYARGVAWKVNTGAALEDAMVDQAGRPAPAAFTLTLPERPLVQPTLPKRQTKAVRSRKAA